MKGLRISMDGAYFLFCGELQKRKGIDSIAQAQLLLAAANPDAEAPPVWRRVST